MTPLRRYLVNPGAATHAALERLIAVLHAALPYIAAAVGFTLLAIAGLAVARWQQQRRMSKGARFISILPPPDADPAGAVVLWSNLMALLRPRWLRLIGGQSHLSFEFHWSAGGLGLGIWVPGTVPMGMVERAVESAWPGCLTTTTKPAAPIPAADRTTGGTLRLVRPEWLPISTSYEVDPLRTLLGAAGTPCGDECAVVQVLARPATGRRVANLYRAAEATRSGRSTKRLLRMLDLVMPRLSASRVAVDLVAAQDARLILSKAAAPQYEVVIRYAVSSGDHFQNTRHALRGRAHGIASAFAVFTGRNGFKRNRLSRPAHVLEQRHMGRGALLSVPELAGIAHLPTDRAVPGLARAGAKPVAPPPAIPLEGKPLGVSETGAARPVALAVADAYHHLHVMGSTGCGKSTLLCNLVLDDVAAGRGVVVVDPKGDLIRDILYRLPNVREKDRSVVLLDPDARSLAPALNVLEGEDPDLVVDNVVGIFRRIFENFWGPRTDDVLRAACLTLLSGGRKATLTEVPKLLTDSAFREERTAALADRVLSGFWTWYDAMGEGQQAQLVGPLMNKLRAFLLRAFVRGVVGSRQSSFSMAKVLDGGLCLVRVPKGELGEHTARLLGSFVVASVWQTVTARARAGEAARVDAALYVDECHNFLTLPRSFDDMLAEARGYRLSLVLAHQHLGQLPVSLREAISANARSKLFFSLSPEDARAVERHTAPEVSAHDLAHLGVFQAVARLVVRGEEQPAFTLRTRPAAEPRAAVADAVRTAAEASSAEAAEHRAGEQAIADEPRPGAAVVDADAAARRGAGAAR